MTQEEYLALWAVANTAQELIDEIRADHPGEPLRSPYLQDLELTLNDLHGVTGCTLDLEGATEDFDFYYRPPEVE